VTPAPDGGRGARRQRLPRAARLLAFAVALSPCACGEAAAPPPRAVDRIERVLRLAPRLAAARLEEPGPARPRAAHTRIRGATLRSIFQHPDSKLVFPSLPILERTTLDLAIGLEDAAVAKGSDGVRFEVLVEAGGSRETVFERLLDPAHVEGDRGWVSAGIPLARWAGQTVDLVFVTNRGAGGDASFDWAHWGDPRLRAEVAARSDRELPNVLLVSFDTLRADHLGTYGFPLDTSPHIDALGERGAVFDSVIAQAPWTLPSHFSLFTGLYPDRRLLRYDLNPCTIGGDVTMLAEVLEREDYLTAAFTGGGYVSASLGFDQGFHVFESHGSRLEDNLPTVLRWIEEHGESRFFLFLHHFNVHRPYEPPEDFLRRYVPRVPKPCEGVAFREDGTEAVRQACLADPAGLDYLRGLYAAEVAHADFLFGRVLAALARRGVLERTLVVVTSDHGEELMDHGALDHVRTVHQEALRIPLVIAGPGVPHGVRIHELVEAVDLPATLLEVLGTGAGLPGDGVSAAGLLACPRPWRSLACLAGAVRSWPDDRRSEAFAATAFDAGLPNLARERHDFKAALVSGDRKLMALGTGSDREDRLYDLDEDPRELHPRPGDGSAEGRRLRQRLDAWVGGIPEDRYCTGSAPSPALRDELEALGYLR
jgi:arylsulfatase A-like enzyme